MKCKVCGINKDEGEFYANDSTCKEDRKARVRANRLRRIEYYRAYDRARGNRQDNDYLRHYRASNPLKYRATAAINSAINSGRMKSMPCEVCGTEDRIHGHHDDYAYPLNVRWLCAAHHQEWHSINGEGLNG